RHDGDLPGRAIPDSVRDRPSAGAGRPDMADDGGGLPADIAALWALAPVGDGVAGDRGGLRGGYRRFRLSASARAGRPVEGPDTGTRIRNAAMSEVDTASGKTHRDENFPVASVLIAPRHRGTILAFYRFARAADDVADHPTLPEAEKLAKLDALEATLLGASEQSV